MAEGNGVQRDLGRLEARQETLEADVAEIKGDVKLILEKINQAKGGGRLILWGGAGAAGMVGSYIVKKLGLS